MTDQQRAPSPPRGLHVAGKRLWRAVTADYELRQHELDLLERACTTLDRLRALDAVIEREGLGAGDRAHPALVEARLQNITFARLIVALRLPDDEDETLHRPQRRGSRGVYQIARRERERLRLRVLDAPAS